MELEGSSTQRFAARDYVFRRQPALRLSTRSTSNDGRSGFCDFRRRTHRCSLTVITGFTAGLGDRCYCLSRTTRPNGAGQLGVHRAAHTPQVGAGVLASFCFAAASSAFSWYAMRHGALLGGTDSTSLVHDLRSLPGIMLNFVLAVPRTLYDRFHLG